AAMVGDAPFDILMGRAAGCRTIAVTYGNGTAEDLRAAGADFLADSFTDIVQMLK
ncbi:MAG: HAD hydrolase-like protein, partial [Bacteroidales bacterium]|nr:HAD hydrolase-like protein [Bacteroidales bacterium]